MRLHTERALAGAVLGFAGVVLTGLAGFSVGPVYLPAALAALLGMLTMVLRATLAGGRPGSGL